MSRRRKIGRERYTLTHQRPRSEVVTAVAGVAAVLVSAALLTWLLRPGSGPGTGGLMHRQPRASWLVLLTVVAALMAFSWVRRTRSRIATNRTAALAGAMALVAVAAVAAGMLWPGGLLRHTPGGLDLPEIELPDISTPDSTVTPPPSETGTPGPTDTLLTEVPPTETSTPGPTEVPPTEAPPAEATVPGAAGSP